jgi:myosin-5
MKCLSPQFYPVIMTVFFSDRNDEKVACQKILDKIGLQGYQVKHTLLTNLLSMYQIFTHFSFPQLLHTQKR